MIAKHRIDHDGPWRGTVCGRGLLAWTRGRQTATGVGPLSYPYHITRSYCSLARPPHTHSLVLVRAISRMRAGPMVRATFWSSKLSTPRSHRHWFCIVAFCAHAPSHRQVPGSSQPNRRATRYLCETWVSDCMLQRLHARLLPLRIRILHKLSHTEFG
jgi:hypothetical protein